MLIQTQLSNYTPEGKFVLECDSGWQMMMGRIRIMLDMVPDLHIDIMGPIVSDEEALIENQVVTSPFELNKDLFDKFGDRLRYIQHWIVPNALATRYDFDFDGLADKLFHDGTKYDFVYMNDPMLLRNFRAMFHIRGKHLPKFFVHSHFIDDPECPKFPVEASLWMGQCEAARKADYNFWQCESSMNIFFEQMAKEYAPHIVEEVRQKSSPWDDGYSRLEMRSKIHKKNVRFDLERVQYELVTKTVIFVPNRIGGRGRSSDYTNCGKFMFEIVPKLFKHRQDFVVIAGNPSQKFSNKELGELCPAFYNIVPDSLNRDEYKTVAHSIQGISVGLYNQDSYGGTSARELCEAGTIPYWADNYEYAEISKQVAIDNLNWNSDRLVKADLSNGVQALCDLIDYTKTLKNRTAPHMLHSSFGEVVYNRCAYEATTAAAVEKMELLV